MYNSNNGQFQRTVHTEVVHDPNTAYPSTHLTTEKVKICFDNKVGYDSLDEEMQLGSQNPALQALVEPVIKDILSSKEAVPALPATLNTTPPILLVPVTPMGMPNLPSMPQVQVPLITMPNPLPMLAVPVTPMGMPNLPSMPQVQVPLITMPNPLPMLAVPVTPMGMPNLPSMPQVQVPPMTMPNLPPPPNGAYPQPSVVKQNYLQKLLSVEKDSLTYRHIVNLFAILALTGIAFERVLRSILARVEKDYITVTPSKDGLYWIMNIHMDNVLYEGNDIVSLYALISGQSLALSIECLFKHICTHEYENSFAAPDKKSYWDFEYAPLFSQDFPTTYKMIFNAFKADFVKKGNFHYPNRLEISFRLKNAKSFTLDFSLMKNKKSSETRWFQKTPPNKAIKLEESTKALPKASLVIQPGQKIPGSEIKRKVILQPIIESGMLIWIYGPEKSFKSRFARILAHSLSHGNTFLDKYKVNSPVSVLFISGEDLPDKFEQACEEELRGANLPVETKFSCILAKALNNASGQINILDPFWKSQIDLALTTTDVIILDCLYSLTTNKVSITELITYITPWKNKGKTFSIIDHTNREGELSGSVDKKRVADLCMELVKNIDGTVTLSFPITRYLGPDDSQPLILRPVFSNDYTFKFETSEEKIPQVSSETKRKMIAHILMTQYGLKQKGKLDDLFSVRNSTISNWTVEAKEKCWQPHEKELLDKYQNMSKNELEDEAIKLKKDK